MATLCTGNTHSVGRNGSVAEHATRPPAYMVGALLVSSSVLSSPHIIQYGNWALLNLEIMNNSCSFSLLSLLKKRHLKSFYVFISGHLLLNDVSSCLMM